MVKRERFSEHEEGKVDRVSLLPDELIVSILCLLSFKEATATSILGRRWRYLHRWTRKLDLDGTKSIRKLLLGIYGDEERLKYLSEERGEFIRWVDGVVGMHKSSTLEAFRIFFNLDKSNTRCIDEWLRFALSRKVESLELSLTYKGRGMSLTYDEMYIFPYKHVAGDDFKFIKKLATKSVHVSGEFVEELLRKCVHLQHLSITQSWHLKSLEIVTPSPSFKCLEISACVKLESLVIRDSGIVSLKMYVGERIKRVVLENVPLLGEIWASAFNLKDVGYMFSSVIPQLHTLKLSIHRDHLSSEKAIRKFGLAAKTSNLKRLVVADTWGTDHSLLPGLTYLMKASPQLEIVVLEEPEVLSENQPASVRLYVGTSRKQYPRAASKTERAKSAATKTPTAYPCLKEVKFVPYRDKESNFELVMHLVENGAALENIVVDPRGVSFHLDSFWDFPAQHKVNHQMDAMARELANYIPSRINLTIL